VIIHRKYKFSFWHYKIHFQITIIMMFCYHLGSLHFIFRFWKLFLKCLLLNLRSYFRFILLHFVIRLSVKIILRRENPKMKKWLSLKIVSVVSIFSRNYLHHHLMMNVMREIMLFLGVFIIFVILFFTEILFNLVLRKMMTENYFQLKVRISLKFLFFVVVSY